MKSRREAGSKLWAFVEDVGVPDQLMADLVGEHIGSGTEFQDVVRHNRIQMRWSDECGGLSKDNPYRTRWLNVKLTFYASDGKAEWLSGIYQDASGIIDWFTRPKFSAVSLVDTWDVLGWRNLQATPSTYLSGSISHSMT